MTKNIQLISLAISLTISGLVLAETISIPQATQTYSVEISNVTCGGEANSNLADYCSGEAQIAITNRATGQTVQIIRPEYLRINKKSLATNASSRGVYGETHAIVFGDFNLDGRDDLAVWTGNNAGYGGPSYGIYLFSPKNGQFARNSIYEKLTNTPYLGLFAIEGKHLVASSKSGCCHHETKKYEIIKNQPVVIERIVEDLNESGARLTQVIYSKKGRKWIKTINRMKNKSS